MEHGLIFNCYFFPFCPFGITGASKEAALPQSHSLFARTKKKKQKSNEVVKLQKLPLVVVKKYNNTIKVSFQK